METFATTTNIAVDKTSLDASRDSRSVVSRAHTEAAEFFEYSTAADPIRASLTPRIPFQFFSASLYAEGPTRVVPLDLSTALKCEAPATGPDLCANFIRIVAGESVFLDPNATSLVFYVIRGEGHARSGQATIEWHSGDFFTVPGSDSTGLEASSDAALYYVNDAPLLSYLGATVGKARFAPTLYTSERAIRELALVANDPSAPNRSRISVLLGNANFPLTRTVTHVLWAMYGLIKPGTMQKPHRHQSIALDFIVDCDEGCYSLVGQHLDDAGEIKNATRVDWEPGCAFVTPPGYWHAHFNTSGREARLIPIQDAGLQTYLRTLDIRFTC
jgi:gentisate 1,2-dioxygenase